jgi:micrococcal nuclease
MKLKPLIAILLAVVILGCVQNEHKPVTFPEHPISTPISISTPALTPTPKPTQTPTIKPVVTIPSAEPTLTQTPTPTSIPTPTPTPAPTLTSTPFTFEFGKKYEAKVIRVIDGDTIDVLINGKTYRIRLLGVDCPETTAEKNKPYEYDSITDLNYLAKWGLKAKEFTEKVLDHGTVYVEFDKLAGLKGYYGRYLAYVYLENGTDFNALLIKNGLARVYVEGTFEKESEYLKLENYAKTHKIGLWAYGTYTVPTPTPTSPLMLSGVKIVYIHYDAPGNDWYNPNGEYVVIKNYGPDSVNLKGWKLKDEAGHTFTFPDITLQPGESVYVYSGKGTNTEKELYWGDGAIWNNDGDTAYLYDSSGRLVDTYSY